MVLVCCTFLLILPIYSNREVENNVLSITVNYCSHKLLILSCKGLQSYVLYDIKINQYRLFNPLESLKVKRFLTLGVLSGVKKYS